MINLKAVGWVVFIAIGLPILLAYFTAWINRRR